MGMDMYPTEKEISYGITSRRRTKGNQVETEKCTRHKNCSLERTNTKYGE
jgi:hypothetical protein